MYRESVRAADTLPLWVRAVLAVAVLVIGASLVVFLSAPMPVAVRGDAVPSAHTPRWIYAALSSTFMALGVGLVLANRRDARAAWLGGVLILAGVPFSTPLLQPSSAAWLSYIRPDAFIAALLWSFLARFPTEFPSRTSRSIVRLAIAAAALAGLWCAVATVVALWVPADAGWSWLTSFGDGPGTTLYWPTILGFTAPAFPVLLWRTATAEPAVRRRMQLFVAGLLAGFAPFTVEVLIEESVPAYKAWAYSPEVAPWIGGVIFGALAIVPFVTAYSVLFDRVVDVRVVLRAAAQYVLARYTIVGVTLVPFAALAVFLVDHRAEPIVSLVTGARPLLLGTVIATGLVSLRLRSRWLNVLDVRYFRESYDAHEVLGRVVALQSTNAERLADGVCQEIAQTFHADAHVFLADDARTALRHVGGQLPPIATGSRLLEMVVADRRPMDVDVDDPQSLLSRLPEDERQWLRSAQVEMLISLPRASGGLEGVLALTSKRSGLPFSTDDRRLLSAIGSVASLAFESLRLRTTSPTPVEPAARECVQCLRLSSSDTERCDCGGNLVKAHVPYVLRGNFRLKQRIGAGGMGVVYKAVDLSLRRTVAIKALPRATPDLVTRLRREARAMAAVSHPNLAVIHGVETWQGMPFLVEEYLGGGTLTQRLAVARPSLRETLDLGLTLAGVLQHMHASGLVHCDIKPSNIGFTQHGVMKLLDFGLARATRDLRAPSASSDSAYDAQSGDSHLESAGSWFGTPHYMSPEAARGEPVAPSFDLWALTVVLYESMAGTRPFRGKDAWELLSRISTEPAPDIRDAWPEAPAAVAAFFEAALSPDVHRRPHDAGAFAAALRRLRDKVN